MSGHTEEELQAAREKLASLGLSVRQASAFIGKTYQTIDLVLNGHITSAPILKDIMRIEEFMDRPGRTHFIKRLDHLLVVTGKDAPEWMTESGLAHARLRGDDYQPKNRTWQALEKAERSAGFTYDPSDIGFHNPLPTEGLGRPATPRQPVEHKAFPTRPDTDAHTPEPTPERCYCAKCAELPEESRRAGFRSPECLSAWFEVNSYTHLGQTANGASPAALAEGELPRSPWETHRRRPSIEQEGSHLFGRACDLAGGYIDLPATIPANSILEAMSPRPEAVQFARERLGRALQLVDQLDATTSQVDRDGETCGEDETEPLLPQGFFHRMFQQVRRWFR